ncbi:MAG: hypothetical protein JST16_01270 [Bdellovibrionales bacterium]|nr:hypothetical protein [Bdellovibrionales bacterium]
METIGVNKLRTLVGGAAEPSLSIYVPAQKNPRQAELTCRRLIEHASDLLHKFNPQLDVHEYIDPIKASVQRFTDILTFDGLAIFKSKSFEGIYRTQQASPELVSVTNHFYLKPLLEILPQSRQFYILRLAEGMAKLYFANADQPVFVKEIRSGETLDDAGGAPVIDIGERKRIWMPFIRATEQVLWLRLNDQPVPVVVVGPRKLVSLYRAINRHPLLGGLKRDDDISKESARTLHAAAWPIARNIFETEIDQFIGLYERMRPLGLTSTDVAKIASAAKEGRVDQLLLAREAEIWGDVDYEQGLLNSDNRARHRHETEILDEIAQVVLRHNGNVRLTSLPRMPKSAAVAAIFRA